MLAEYVERVRAESPAKASGAEGSQENHQSPVAEPLMGSEYSIARVSLVAGGSTPVGDDEVVATVVPLAVPSVYAVSRKTAVLASSRSAEDELTATVTCCQMLT